MRLFDIESMSRIAHIDRPTGARSSLYPTISSLHPSIMFERSDALLIGWGDCLMSMLIRDLTNISKFKDNNQSKEVKRKTVECTMAWELDCVACSVVPVDEKHVAVLGLVPSVPTTADEGDERPHDSTYLNNELAGGDNIIELQIISREDGKSISNDRIPLVEKRNADMPDNKNRINTTNASGYSLLSSFANQRMDDVAEWEALDETEKEIVRKEISTYDSEFATNRKYPDSYLRWSMVKDVCSLQLEQADGNDILLQANVEDHSDTSTCSVLSDDYVFPLSEPIHEILLDPTVPSNSQPPTMVISSIQDVCLVQTRDIDDVISYSRSHGKPAMALKKALAHRRDVKRHGIDLLVDEYFAALLRMRDSSIKLSISRLQVAAQSLPILLGGDARMWQRWIFMFARIPGGLFVIRDKIPVRGELQGKLVSSNDFLVSTHNSP